MKKQKNKTSNKGRTVAEILGAGAFVAAALYFLYGTKKGVKRRKKIKGWMLMMKGEIAHKAENLKNLSEKSYKEIIDKTAAKFKRMKNVSTSEVSALAGELKKHWSEIAKEAGLKSRKIGSKRSSSKKAKRSSAKRK